jgi:hypothetical protein
VISTVEKLVISTVEKLVISTVENYTFKENLSFICLFAFLYTL